MSTHEHTLQRPHWGWWAAVLGGILVLGILSFHSGAYQLWSRHITTVVPQLWMKWVFWSATLIHVAEAFYAYKLCEMMQISGPVRNAWVFQTFLLGFPSLRLLRRLL